jgi:hypothetical protein
MKIWRIQWKKKFWLNSSRRCKSRSDPFKQTSVYIGVLSLYEACNDIYKEIIMFIKSYFICQTNKRVSIKFGTANTKSVG